MLLNLYLPNVANVFLSVAGVVNGERGDTLRWPGTKATSVGLLLDQATLLSEEMKTHLHLFFFCFDQNVFKVSLKHNKFLSI